MILVYSNVLKLQFIPFRVKNEQFKVNKETESTMGALKHITISDKCLGIIIIHTIKEEVLDQ